MWTKLEHCYKKQTCNYVVKQYRNNNRSVAKCNQVKISKLVIELKKSNSFDRETLPFDWLNGCKTNRSALKHVACENKTNRLLTSSLKSCPKHCHRKALSHIWKMDEFEKSLNAPNKSTLLPPEIKSICYFPSPRHHLMLKLILCKQSLKMESLLLTHSPLPVQLWRKFQFLGLRKL